MHLLRDNIFYVLFFVFVLMMKMEHTYIKGKTFFLTTLGFSKSNTEVQYCMM